MTVLPRLGIFPHYNMGETTWERMNAVLKRCSKKYTGPGLSR